MYSHPDIEEILLVFENSNCFDCGASSPKWTSQNNGIFLCLNCARKHHQYDPLITRIRSLQTDHFTEEDLVFLMKGGNHKLKLFLAEYDITPDSPFEMKYFSKAANYYRKNLENEVYKVTKQQYIPSLLIKPDIKEGTQLLEITKNPDIKSESLFDKIGDAAKYVGKGLEDMNIGEKLKSAGSTVYDYAKTSGSTIYDYAKTGGSTVYDYAKTGGSYIAGKTQEAYNSEFVQNITRKAGEGISNAYQTAKSYIIK